MYAFMHILDLIGRYTIYIYEYCISIYTSIYDIAGKFTKSLNLYTGKLTIFVKKASSPRKKQSRARGISAPHPAMIPYFPAVVNPQTHSQSGFPQHLRTPRLKSGVPHWDCTHTSLRPRQRLSSRETDRIFGFCLAASYVYFLSVWYGLIIYQTRLVVKYYLSIF